MPSDPLDIYHDIFIDPIPVEVYILDFNSKSVKRYDVYKQQDLLGNQYTVLPLSVDTNTQRDWINFTVTTETFFANPFQSNLGGYDFLSNQSIRNQVNNSIGNNWYGLIKGSASFLQLIDSFVTVIPNDNVFNKITIRFADNVEVTLSLRDASQMSFQEILKADLVYVADSANYIDENGNKVKIPDDVKESIEPSIVSFTSKEAFQNHQDYMTNYGFTWGSSTDGAGGSTRMSCSTVEKPATDEKPRTYVMTCVLR